MNEQTRDQLRDQAATIIWGGPDGPDDNAESAEETKARKSLEAEYEDVPQFDDSEYEGDGEHITGSDESLIEAARTLDDPNATAENIEYAREVLLDSVGGFDDQDVDTDVPTDKAAYQQMIAAAVRQGMTPLSPYAHDGEVDDATATHSAVDSVAREIAIQTAAKKALGVPGYGDQVSQAGPRAPNEIAAIEAVRQALLRRQGIEPSDLDNPPQVDMDYEQGVSDDYAEWDKQLGLEPGTSATQGAKDDAAFEAGGLE